MCRQCLRAFEAGLLGLGAAGVIAVCSDADRAGVCRQLPAHSLVAVRREAALAARGERRRALAALAQPVGLVVTW